jgi:hypothetical protein
MDGKQVGLQRDRYKGALSTTIPGRAKPPRRRGTRQSPRGASTRFLDIGTASIHILALAPSWVRAGWGRDDRCDHPPNRRAERAFALAASSSRSLGGAVVSSEASKRSEILAMSSTAE